MQKPTPLTPEQKSTGRKVLAVMFTLLVLGLYVLYQKACNQPPAPPTAYDYKYSAYSLSHTFVERAIKSPATAKFNPFDTANVLTGANNKYIVKGWVDAQNSFGATLRNQYICELQMDTLDRATLISLNFLP